MQIAEPTKTAWNVMKITSYSYGLSAGQVQQPARPEGTSYSKFFLNYAAECHSRGSLRSARVCRARYNNGGSDAARAREVGLQLVLLRSVCLSEHRHSLIATLLIMLHAPAAPCVRPPCFVAFRNLFSVWFASFETDDAGADAVEKRPRAAAAAAAALAFVSRADRPVWPLTEDAQPSVGRAVGRTSSRLVETIRKAPNSMHVSEQNNSPTKDRRRGEARRGEVIRNAFLRSPADRALTADRPTRCLNG